MYILVKNGSIVSDSYSLNKLRQDNPDVSFPVVITSEILQEFGVFYLEDNPPTNVDPYRSVRKTDITFTSTGEWVQNYEVVPATEQEIKTRTVSESETVRLNRDKLLTKSDWVVIKALENSQPLSFDWAEYRQQLRDITAQPGFPFNIQWPSAPV